MYWLPGDIGDNLGHLAHAEELGDDAHILVQPFFGVLEGCENPST